MGHIDRQSHDNLKSHDNHVRSPNSIDCSKQSDLPVFSDVSKDFDSSQLTFIADSMLGRLAKWLRLLGQDVYYSSHIDDSDLLRTARDECRIILTKDTLIMKRREVKKGLVKAVFIKSEHLFVQIDQLFKDLKLKPNYNKTRCNYDNNLLEQIKKEAVRNKVPAYVYETQKLFSYCKICKRIYWQGTQWDSLRHRVDELIRN